MKQTPETQPDRSGVASVTTRSKVAVVYTTPETVQDDIARAMHLAGYQAFLPKSAPTLLKINISWQHYYPACSTTPWQIEGVVKTLLADGYEKPIAAHNGTVVVDPREGELNNKHKAAQDRHGLESVYLDVPPVKWVRYEPRAKMLALDEIYPEGIEVPEVLRSGDHGRIDAWRREQALEATRRKRPDLLGKEASAPEVAPRAPNRR